MTVFISGKPLLLAHDNYTELAKAGIVELGVNDSVAQQIASIKGLKSLPSGTNAANSFWRLIGWVIFICSIYLSFTESWWIFVPGTILAGILWNINEKSNSLNLLNDADRDAYFYENVNNINGWLYKVKDDQLGEFYIRTWNAADLAANIVYHQNEGDETIVTFQKAKDLLIFCGVRLSETYGSFDESDLDDDNDRYSFSYDGEDHNVSSKRQLITVIARTICSDLGNQIYKPQGQIEGDFLIKNI